MLLAEVRGVAAARFDRGTVVLGEQCSTTSAQRGARRMLVCKQFLGMI
jgi:hypothetical protein